MMLYISSPRVASKYICEIKFDGEYEWYRHFFNQKDSLNIYFKTCCSLEKENQQYFLNTYTYLEIDNASKSTKPENKTRLKHIEICAYIKIHQKYTKFI